MSKKVRIKVYNYHYGTSCWVLVPYDGRLSDKVVASCFKRLSGVPGDGSGPLGESGPFPHPGRPNLYMAVYKDEKGYFIGPLKNPDWLDEAIELCTPTDDVEWE